MLRGHRNCPPSPLRTTLRNSSDEANLALLVTDLEHSFSFCQSVWMQQQHLLAGASIAFLNSILGLNSCSSN